MVSLEGFCLLHYPLSNKTKGAPLILGNELHIPQEHTHTFSLELGVALDVKILKNVHHELDTCMAEKT